MGCILSCFEFIGSVILWPLKLGFFVVESALEDWFIETLIDVIEADIEVNGAKRGAYHPLDHIKYLVYCDILHTADGQRVDLVERSEPLAERSSAVDAAVAEIQQAFTKHDTVAVVGYEKSTGVATLGWRGVHPEKREAFQNARVNVQGLFFKSNIIPNGTFNGWTPEGVHVEGRWRIAPHDFDREHATPESIDALTLPQYYAGDAQYNYWTNEIGGY